MTVGNPSLLDEARAAQSKPTRKRVLDRVYDDLLAKDPDRAAQLVELIQADDIAHTVAADIIRKRLGYDVKEGAVGQARRDGWSPA